MKEYRTVIEKPGNLRVSYVIKAVSSKEAEHKARKLAKELKAVVINTEEI